jgi:hypothetical protein
MHHANGNFRELSLIYKAMPTLISLRFTTHTFYTLLPIVSTNTIEIDYLRPRKRRRCGLVWTSENEGLIKINKSAGRHEHNHAYWT